jgi:hypothetical protein
VRNELLQRVSSQRLRDDLFYLSRDPLPYRKINYTRPGLTRTSLEEADAYIHGQLATAGYAVGSNRYPVQAFRCDASKPLHHWYAAPDPADPWVEVANLEATLPGHECPDEIIQLVAHKDSMSWIDSPGAHDNATGTVANLELARVLGRCRLRRTVRWLFCNEEHTPWTSLFAAQEAKARGDRLMAVLNVDGLDGKPDAEAAAGRLLHVVGYSTEEGRPLAELIAAVAERQALGLDVTVFHKQPVNDDDGMFIRAGYPTTVMNSGSFPYGDAEYHLPGDGPERVNIENLRRSTQLLLAAIWELDQRANFTL